MTLTLKMTSLSSLMNCNCEQIEALKKLVRKDILYVALRCLVLKWYQFIKKNTSITSLIAAILILLENEAFRMVDSGGVLCVFLYSPTESNYAEKHLLTFISIQYLGIFHLKMQIIHIFRCNYLTLSLFVTSVDLLWIWNVNKWNPLEKLCEKTYIICVSTTFSSQMRAIFSKIT